MLYDLLLSQKVGRYLLHSYEEYFSYLQQNCPGDYYPDCRRFLSGLHLRTCCPCKRNERIFTSAELLSGSGFLSQFEKLMGNEDLPQTTETIRCGGEHFREGVREVGIVFPSEMNAESNIIL